MEKIRIYLSDAYRFFKDVKVSVVVNRVDFAGTDVVSMYKICGGY